MFRRRSGTADVTVYVDDIPHEAIAGDSVASLLLTTSQPEHRTSVISGSPRAPYCLMGVCFECLVEIDGNPYQRACLVPLAHGMRIRRQRIVQEQAWW
ncbi:MAG: (2Fe-2S)-binding protein [Steroidobacteraceae bacterium]